MQLSQQSFLSRMSIILSSLCIIHCLSVPLIIIALPAVAGFFPSTIETILIASVIPISALSFVPTWLKHKNFLLLATYVVSITLILAGHFGHHHLGFFNGFTELFLVITGAFGIAVAIYRNNRHTHVCKNPHHDH